MSSGYIMACIRDFKTVKDNLIKLKLWKQQNHPNICKLFLEEKICYNKCSFLHPIIDVPQFISFDLIQVMKDKAEEKKYFPVKLTLDENIITICSG